MDVSSLVNAVDMDATPGMADYMTTSDQPSLTTPAVVAAYVQQTGVVGSCVCLVC